MIALFVVLVPESLAQGDTNEIPDLPLYLFEFSDEDFENDRPKELTVDTLLNRLLYPSHPGQRYGFSTGNIGSPGGPLWWRGDYQLGFDPGLHFLDQHHVTADSVKYFSVNQPYSTVNFTNATGSEVGVRVVHTQNIRRNWNVGVDYDLIGGEGLMQRQRNRRSNFVAHSNFIAPDNRYRALFHYRQSRSLIQENGGLEDDQNFTDNLALQPVNLLTASNDLSKSAVFFKQMFRIGRRDTTSAPEDSIVTTRLVPKFQFFHTFHWQQMRNKFEDESPDSAFFSILTPELPFSFSDIIRVSRVENTFGIQNQVAKTDPKGVLFKFWGSQESFRFWQFRHTLEGQNIKVGGTVGFDQGIFRSQASGESVLGGFNTGDTRLSWMMRTDLGDTDSTGNWRVEGGLNWIRERPQYLRETFSAQEFNWNNGFEKVLRGTAKLGISNPGRDLSVGVKYSLINNLVYYDSTQTPVQVKDEAISIVQAYLDKGFEWKNIHLDLGARFQTVSGGNVLRLPDLMTFSSLYYENMVFKKVMLLRFGADLFMTNEYKLIGYNPAIRDFYAQEDRELGGYPFLDVYLAARVKKFRAYLKVQHANTGLFGQDYFTVQGYPVPTRTIRVGIDWMFLN